MDFTFNRQSSKDFLFKKSEALKSSFSTSASGVRSGLFGGISQVQNKLDKIGNKISSSLDLDDGEDYLEEKQRLLEEQTRQQKERQRIQQQAAAANSSTNTTSHNQSNQEKAALLKQKAPPKPPLPKQLSRGSIDLNGGSAAPFNDRNKQQRKKIPAPTEQEINFKEPLFAEQDAKATNNGNGNSGIIASHLQAGAGGIGGGSGGRTHNPFTPASNGQQMQVGVEVHQTAQQHQQQQQPDITQTPHVPDLMQRRRTNPFIDVYDDAPDQLDYTSTTRFASVPNTIHGIDLLPGIPRVPSQSNTNQLQLNPNQLHNNSADLLAITPTSGAALPIPGIDPIPANTRRGGGSGGGMEVEHEIYDDSDADSVATEGCDENVDVADEYGDPIDDAELLKSGSVASDLSWSSNDSHMDGKSKECMEFMKNYVTKIFNISLKLTAVEKSRFGELCQHELGRLWFARYINAQRLQNKKVAEHSFFQLVQYFAIVLFECNEQEDYGPAKTLMDMCFTFYHEVDHPTGPSHKHYLYSYLKDQPIWQSLKFWNAAYFDAIMIERTRPVPKQATTSGDDREYQRNITFQQLGTFICNMTSFGLSKEICLEFLRKQSVVANLQDEQIQLLRDNIDKGIDVITSRR